VPKLHGSVELQHRGRDTETYDVHSHIYISKLNSVAMGHERTIPTERLPLVGEVSVKFLPIEAVEWSAPRIPTTVFSAL
jgi:hypothetical protein